MTSETLKRDFTSLRFLVHQDPMKPSIVEANSSNYAIGAALPWASDIPNKLHPGAFYAWAQTLSTRSYDIWD